MKQTLIYLALFSLTVTLVAQPGGGRGPANGPFGGGRGPGTFGQRPGGPGPDPRRELMPASLRLGLLQTLGRIGTNESEAALVKVLGYTVSGVEVALIDEQLTLIAEGEHQYKKQILGAAKDILIDPPALSEVPSRLEFRAESALWDLIIKYQDTTFAEAAAELLVKDDAINDSALRFFSSVMKEQSVPVLAQAYQQANLSDRSKDRLYGVINDYLDQHPQSGQVLVERFQGYLVKMGEEEAERAKAEAEREAARANGENPSGGRGADFLRNMFGGRGGGGSRGAAIREIQRLGEGKPDADGLALRRGILTSLKATTNDADFVAMFTAVEERFNALANPEAEGFSERFRVTDPAAQRREEERRKRIEEFRNRENNPPAE